MAFIKAVAEQTLKPENILKIGEFIDIFHENVKTNLSVDTIKDYIPYAVNFNTENLKQLKYLEEMIELKKQVIGFSIRMRKKHKKIVEELFYDVEDTDQNEMQLQIMMFLIL